MVIPDPEQLPATGAGLAVALSGTVPMTAKIIIKEIARIIQPTTASMNQPAGVPNKKAAIPPAAAASSIGW